MKLSSAQRAALDLALSTSDLRSPLLVHDLRSSRAMVRSGVLLPLDGEFGSRFKLTEEAIEKLQLQPSCRCSGPMFHPDEPCPVPGHEKKVVIGRATPGAGEDRGGA